MNVENTFSCVVTRPVVRAPESRSSCVNASLRSKWKPKKFGFHPERLAQAKAPLMDMIQQLPDQFLKNKGGGWTFLNLCNRKDESQWTGEHKTMEALVCLAIGAGIGAYCAPRDIWPVFPGGMPYVVFDLPTIS